MGILFEMIFVILVVVLIYLVLCNVFAKKKGRNRTRIDRKREFFIGVFVAYITFMVFILFLIHMGGLDIFIDKGFFNPIYRIQNNIGVNLIPFKTITDIYNYSASPSVVTNNIFGNIILFIPVSLLMVLLWPRWRRVRNMVLFSVLIPILIETIQLFIGRAVDIDDVILNFIGLMIGFLAGKFLSHIFKGR